MKLTRAIIPLAAAALLLTGCTAGGGAITSDASGEACAPASDASKSVKIDGDLGGTLSLTAGAPMKAGKSIERSVLKDGKGEVFAEGQVATANYTIFNGKTGDVVNLQAEAKIPNDAKQLEGADWLYEAVRCGAVGQRTAIVTSVEDALGGADPAAAGFTDLAKDDAFVIVFDFTGASEVCEDEKPREEKYPEVDLGDGKSEPKITIPKCMEAPADFELKVLEEGDGEVVKDGDAVMTNYVGVDWNGAERFDGNWSDTGIRFDTNGVIAGFKQAMVGQKIGSTILVTMPSELGYNDGMTRTFVLQLVKKTE